MPRIKTYARLKPAKKETENYSIHDKVLTLHIPEGNFGSPANRNSVKYDIGFDRIFRPKATQEDVFNTVAQDIIDNFLIGYNGTIFAYGQTGTGKTYTVEGNSLSYQTRGLATRALSKIYGELEKRTDEHITVYLSYLEIYQEVAFDLLNPASRTTLPIIPFSKVTVMEGPNGSCVLRGLSLHMAANEEVAQMLLIQGQANRKIAETPVNMRSSRSHAVFSVYLQARKKDSQVILSSKLHLVDLAGSERVSKTGVDGQQLTEAKSINLSLHHLETVIIFLQNRGADEQQQKSGKADSSSNSQSSNSVMSNLSSECSSLRSRHIPYRNSLLTMILKDSLGGNCLTAMIATISMEQENLGESLSTCRFAQRVARVANFARRNEEIDDKLLIKKLKMKVAQLETQVALLLSKRERGDGDESSGDVDYQQVVEEFLQGIIDDPVSAGISTQFRFRQCLQLMKSRMLENGMSFATPPNRHPSHLVRSLPTQTSPKLREGWLPLEDLAPAPTFDGAIQHLSPESSVKHMDLNSPAVSAPDTDCSIPHNTTKRTHESQRQHQDHAKSSRKETGLNVSASDLEEDPPMDELDKLLMAATSTSTTHSPGFKTPFERKREKKIKKLGKILSCIEEEKVAQEEELEIMKQDTVLDSLRMEEDGLRLKLQVADEQVADQHAYLLHLKHIESDPELLAQEILVEKQLQKRQTKFQASLKDVRERRIGVERELSQMAQGKGRDQPDKKGGKTLEEKFGQFRQNRGSLNTRQVFEMLKNEEKRQKKEIGKVEREKTVMKTKQLELKEMATWEKLRELKLMLKMSQRVQEQEGQGQQGHNFVPTTAMSNVSENSGPSQSQRSVAPSNELSFIRDPSPTSDAHVSARDSSVSEPSHAQLITEYIQSVQYKIDSQQEPDRSDNKQSEQPWHRNDPSVIHSCDASWPNTPSSNLSENVSSHKSQSTPSVSVVNGQQSSVPVDRGGAINGQLNEPETHIGYQTTKPVERNDVDGLGLGEKGGEKSDCNNNSHSKDKWDLEHIRCDHLDLEETDDHNAWGSLLDADLGSRNSTSPQAVGFSSRQPRRTSSPNRAPVKSKTLVKSDFISEKEKALTIEQIMGSLSPSTVQYNPSIDNHHKPHTAKPRKVLPPSEYINSMTEKERFDARRMGLSSRTFESALSHMLDEPDSELTNHNVPNLPYSVDPYERYMRKSSSPHNNDIYSRKSSSLNSHHQPIKHHSTKKSSSHQKRDGLKDSTSSILDKSLAGSDKRSKVRDEPSTWGPNVKNMSIADRLSGLFDETPSDFLPSQNTSQNTRDRELSNRSPPVERWEQQLSVGVPEEEAASGVESCNEEDSFFGQLTPRSAITALKKEEGEKTFMSIVASERERIARIRKARHAAEVIQKYWRKSRTK